MYMYFHICIYTLMYIIPQVLKLCISIILCTLFKFSLSIEAKTNIFSRFYNSLKSYRTDRNLAYATAAWRHHRIV